MEIVKIKVQKLEVQKGTLTEILYKQEDTDFVQYLYEILKDVNENEKSRKYQFISDTSEIYTLISRSIYEDKFEESVNRSSKRLLEEEQDAQKKIAHLGTEIQKGILIHAHVKDKNHDIFIICKADDIPYIDESNLKKANGFPLKKKIFKSFLVEFENPGNIIRTQIFDTYKFSSVYWWSGYLELNPVVNNSENTVRAFEALDNIIFNPIRKESPADHWQLRNALVTAMKSDNTFDIIEYADEVISRYRPINEDINIKTLVTKIKGLPEKYKFDPVFDLDSTAITAKVKQVVQLTENIDLTIKANIDTTNTIIPILGLDKKTKYIQIRSDIGYDTFINKQKDK
jgi:hypothetical protein